jgi:thioredoxin-like negative regulator of GroEL
MKKALICLTVAVLAVGSVYAQSYKGKGRLYGFVTDQDGKPLEGVRVVLYSLKASSGLEVKSDAKGEWTAMYVRGGGWNVDLEKVGYMPKRLSVHIMETMDNPAVKSVMSKVEGLVITDEMKAALNEGNNLFAQGKFQEAAAAYQAIVDKTPEIYLVYKNVGNCWFELQDYAKAEEFYKKVLDKEPNNSEVLMLVGNCYANRNETDKAMEWYSKIEFDKITDTTVLYNIGIAYTKQSKLDDALKYYKKAVELQADFLDGLYQLGLTYLALGKNPEAIAAFESYVAKDADSERATQVKGFLDFLKKK